MHRGRALVEHLHPVHADVARARARVLRDHGGQRDERPPSPGQRSGPGRVPRSTSSPRRRPPGRRRAGPIAASSRRSTSASSGRAPSRRALAAAASSGRPRAAARRRPVARHRTPYMRRSVELIDQEADASEVTPGFSKRRGRSRRPSRFGRRSRSPRVPGRPRQRSGQGSPSRSRSAIQARRVARTEPSPRVYGLRLGALRPSAYWTAPSSVSSRPSRHAAATSSAPRAACSSQRSRRAPAAPEGSRRSRFFAWRSLAPNRLAAPLVASAACANRGEALDAVDEQLLVPEPLTLSKGFLEHELGFVIALLEGAIKPS